MIRENPVHIAKDRITEMDKEKQEKLSTSLHCISKARYTLDRQHGLPTWPVNTSYWTPVFTGHVGNPCCPRSSACRK